jgi:Leucine-rich repeat (LRR) protein
MFDKSQVENSYQQLKNEPDFPQAYLEEIFLIGKLTNDANLKAEIEALIQQHFDKTVSKAFKSRKQFPKPDKFMAYNVMETLMNYGTSSPTLRLGKMYELLGFDSIFIYEKQKWAAIPEDLARFDNIRELTLHNDSRITVLPAFLQTLTQLEKIEAESVTEFPTWIQNLPALRDLNIRLGRLPEFPQALLECEHLEELDLDGRMHWSGKAEPHIVITGSFKKLKKLKKLRMYYFDQEELAIGRFSNLKHLPTSLGSLKKLYTLEIHVMDNLEELPLFLTNLTNLQTLRVGNLPVVKIPLEVLGLPKLETTYFNNMPNMQLVAGKSGAINLKRFKIEGEKVWQFFWDNLEAFKALEELVINFGHQTPDLPDAIGELQNLRKLGLSGNLCTISPRIAALQNLEELSIGGASNLVALPNELRQLTNLHKLYISSGLNLERMQLVVRASALPLSPYLDAEIECKAFEVDLQETHPLTKLSLRCFEVYGDENLHHFKHLKSLKLGRNKHVLEGLGGLENLEYLELSMRETDYLPTSIGKLQNLQEITIWGSETLKNIPKEFAQLKKLRKAYITGYLGNDANEFLEGLDLQELEFHNFPALDSLPEALTNMKNLEKLVMYDCKQMKSIGKTLEKLTSLKHFSARFVAFDSNTIDSIVKLTNLERLALSYWDNLEALPIEITDLKKLKDLCLEHTDRIREIPDFIGELKNLETLVLEGLRLPTLPTTLIHLPKLTQMSISTTWFDAPLPEELRALRLKKLGNWQSKFAGHNQKRAVYEVLLSHGTEMVKTIE